MSETDKQQLTRAQKRAARRARRSSPQAKARRLARLQQRQADARIRLDAMQARPFDPAWQVQL